MKNGRFQAKDIDDRFFLECVDYLSMQKKYPWEFDYRLHGVDLLLGPRRLPHWVNRGDLDYVMPVFPPAVILAKASQLMKRKLLDGCDCGCRGDFHLTETGQTFLQIAREAVPL